MITIIKYLIKLEEGDNQEKTETETETETQKSPTKSNNKGNKREAHLAIYQLSEDN